MCVCMFGRVCACVSVSGLYMQFFFVVHLLGYIRGACFLLTQRMSYSELHLLAWLVLPPWFVPHARGVMSPKPLVRRCNFAPRGLRRCWVLVRARDNFRDPDAVPTRSLRSRGS